FWHTPAFRCSHGSCPEPQLNALAARGEPVRPIHAGRVLAVVPAQSSGGRAAGYVPSPDLPSSPTRPAPAVPNRQKRSHQVALRYSPWDLPPLTRSRFLQLAYHRLRKCRLASRSAAFANSLATSP